VPYRNAEHRQSSLNTREPDLHGEVVAIGSSIMHSMLQFPLAHLLTRSLLLGFVVGLTLLVGARFRHGALVAVGRDSALVS
jgi:hypothetical protein